MGQKPTFDPRAHVDHMEAVLGLEIRPEWRDSVVRYMATTAEAAALVNDFRLDDAVEIAPTFKA
ncbi:MAG: DUF4089 domain-containing protein [Pseudomonadota bacterium]